MSNLFNPFPGPHPRYDYDLSTELSPALYLSIPIGPLHSAELDDALTVIFVDSVMWIPEGVSSSPWGMAGLGGDPPYVPQVGRCLQR
ncbi:MAG: hypothetical protein ACYDC5_10300 [Candidatus Dormibacteria bacterium]